MKHLKTLLAKAKSCGQSTAGTVTPNDSKLLVKNDASSTQEGSKDGEDATNMSRNLADEFGNLSLSASAEGHYLGPGSGISFAKFTQSLIYQMDSRNEQLINDGAIISVSAGTPSSAASPEARTVPTPDGHSSINDDPLEPINPETATLLEQMLPDAYRAADLAEFYWRHSHTLYPFIQKELFTEKLGYMLDPRSDSEWAGIESDPAWLFQLFMVLAIGSTSMASITVSNEDEAVACWQKAMTYLPIILSQGSRIALESIMLLVSYSFFNRMGPDTWYLVGIASRLALGMGLHSEKSLDGLTHQGKEHTKRVFWSLYMMDRVVSTTLGRPLAIRDADIAISPFSKVEDAALSWNKRSYLDVTLHILSLRKIAGETLEKVYTINQSKDLSDEKKKEIVHSLHQRLVEWRRGMPFPLNESQFTLIPHLTTAWFDLNYYNMVIMIFRPSPLWPNPPPDHVHLVADAAAMALKQFHNMYRQQKLSFNWLNLLSVFCATLAMLFITTTRPEDWPAQFLDVDEVVSNLRLSEELFDRFAVKLAPARACLSIVRKALDDIMEKHGEGHASPRSGDQELSNGAAMDGEKYPVCGPTHGNVDSVMSMFSMDNDTYYDNLVTRIDEYLLSVPMAIDDENLTNNLHDNFFFDIGAHHSESQ